MKTKHFDSRREFLKKSSVFLGAAATAGLVPKVYAAGSENTLKIGLVGCGGRGRGAVIDAMNCGEANLELVAVADIFKEQAENSVRLLKNEIGDRVKVAPDMIFDGFQGYQSVIAASDVVFLCSPQLFRPMMLKAALEAGKHVFCEKPVAADPAGIRSALESAAYAQKHKLSIVTGLINRYSSRVRETVKRIHDGQIGPVVSTRANRMGGPLWIRPRMEGDTEFKYQMRNWVNFDWITGEFINDVTVHQLDVALWCVGDDLTPVKAFGTGGRLVRKGEGTGDMYDSMAVVFEYADGRPLYAFSRQIPRCYGSASAFAHGPKGFAEIGNVGWGRVAIGGENPFEAPQENRRSPYNVQHSTLIRSIRGGEYANHLPYTAKATMAAILGKLATFSGKQMTWEEALNMESTFDVSKINWDFIPPTLPNEVGEYKITVPV